MQSCPFPVRWKRPAVPKNETGLSQSPDGAGRRIFQCDAEDFEGVANAIANVKLPGGARPIANLNADLNEADGKGFGYLLFGRFFAVALFAGRLQELGHGLAQRLGTGGAGLGEFLGGDKEVICNIELIFPLFEDIKMKGVVFFDTGNVWGAGEDWDFGDLRYVVGGGIRWVSPLGPIRVEWGYNLDPREDEDHSEWSFSVGTSF